MTHTKIVKEKLKEIERRNKAHRKEAIRLKIEPFDDGGWYDTIEIEDFLEGMQIAIKSELEFLERDMMDFMNINGTCFRIMNNRITDCKNALKLIEDKR